MTVDLISGPLLRWYEKEKRPLIWRISERDHYRTWLAEIMAQQTSAQVAARYWQKFLDLWPSVADLAAADDEEVMHAWAGLGYYARARNLLKTARIITENGGFPKSAEELRQLPGIGPYTSNAIAAIASGEPVLAVDTNVGRVAARLFTLHDPKAAATLLSTHVPSHAPGDFNEALMDLGASICTARAANCGLCPLANPCLGRASGAPEDYPKRAAKTPRPERYGTAWWVEHQNKVALIRRPPKGLLGGMPALPGPEWSDTPDMSDKKRGQPLGQVTHVFTHFRLILSINSLKFDQANDVLNSQEVQWHDIDSLDKAGLPALYLKAAKLAREERP